MFSNIVLALSYRTMLAAHRMPLKMRNKKKEVPLTGAFGVVCILAFGFLVLEYQHFKVLEEMQGIVESVVVCDEAGYPYTAQGTRRVYSGVLGWWDEAPPSTATCPVVGMNDATIMPDGHVALPTRESTVSKIISFQVPAVSPLLISGRQEMADQVFGLSRTPDSCMALSRKSQICKDNAWHTLEQGDFKSEFFYPSELLGQYYRIPGKGLRRVLSKGQLIATPEYDFSLKARDFKMHTDGWLYDGEGGVCRENGTRVSHWWHEVVLPLTVLARHDGGGALSQVSYSNGYIFKVRKGLQSPSKVLKDVVHPLGRVSFILRGACILSSSICLAVAGLPSITAVGAAVLTSSLAMSTSDYFLWGVCHISTTLALSLPSAAVITLDFLVTRCLFRRRPHKGRQQRVPQPGPRFKQKVQ